MKQDAPPSFLKKYQTMLSSLEESRQRIENLLKLRVDQLAGSVEVRAASVESRIKRPGVIVQCRGSAGHAQAASLG